MSKPLMDSLSRRLLSITPTTFNRVLANASATNGEAFDSEVDQTLPIEAHQMLRSLETASRMSFAVLDTATGQIVRTAPANLQTDLYRWLPACEHVARRARPEILDEVSPLALLAAPLVGPNGESNLVALTAFITDRVREPSEVTAAAHEFGVPVEQTYEWAKEQTPWPIAE